MSKWKWNGVWTLVKQIFVANLKSKLMLKYWQYAFVCRFISHVSDTGKQIFLLQCELHWSYGPGLQFKQTLHFSPYFDNLWSWIQIFRIAEHSLSQSFWLTKSSYLLHYNGVMAPKLNLGYKMQARNLWDGV